MKMKLTLIYCFLVVLFHIVGFLGFITPSSVEFFKRLVPLYILMMFILILLSHRGRNNDFWKFITAAYIAGFVIQLLGVHTGEIFGQFQYGHTLGFKFADVPLLIGLNWIIVIYSAGSLLKRFKIKNRIIRSAMGAMLITILDYLIEPVAIRNDYWSWSEFDVPVQNYLAWFVFSFLMLLLFYKMRISKSNILGAVLFICQFLFFLGLNFVLV